MAIRNRSLFGRLFFLILCLYVTAVAHAQVEPSFRMPHHPRLLMPKGDEAAILQDLQTDSTWGRVHREIIRRTDEFSQPPYTFLQRQLEGKRLLSVSREALRRIFFASYAYRLTNDSRYFDYARAEMLNVCRFSDWNPSHFLDVAEMTLAVSIGYDWLYDKLPKDDRHTIATAIAEKGLKPSLTEGKELWWVSTDNNWNQVCHAGMLFGAIATWENDKQLSVRLINRAIAKLPLAMQVYAPDGVYPEGTGYWDYGTSFCVLAIEALTQMFGTDFHLSEAPGFLLTGQYITHLTTPALHAFCYSDNGNNMHSMPTAFWFYRRTQDKSILYNQKRIMHRRNPEDLAGSRLAPTAILWGHDLHFESLHAPSVLSWAGGGDNAVYVTRSGWGYDDAFMGMKSGSPSVNHAHMDEGSFIYESHGVKWALDPGTENYGNLEQAGLGIWDSRQHSDRWTVFRYNNQSHNTLTFDGQLQKADGKVEFKSRVIGFPGQASADLTPVYEGQVKRVVRTCSLDGIDDLTVTDEIETDDRPTELTWTLMTEAKGTVIGDQSVMLEKNDRRVRIDIDGVKGGKWHVEAATPSRPFENQNQGITRLRFVVRLPGKTAIRLKAHLSGMELNIVSKGDHWVWFENHPDIVAGSALDFSGFGLQDAPAGKYGWLTVKDGSFVFEKRKRTPQRFYGVNLCFSANYPTHEVADMLTERLVRLGYNSIRIHHYDDTWSRGDSEMIDRLDYLLASAMKRGLYITTDLFVSRSVSWRSIGVDQDGNVEMDLFKSLIACYDPAFQNWCAFAKDFLLHCNPYTGRMYKDEPGMPLISLINEGSLFMGFDTKKKDPRIRQAYDEFTGKHEEMVWGNQYFEPFMDWLEQRAAQRCMAFVRELGCNALLTNDNNGWRHGRGEAATDLYDYVDNHFYIDHPSFLQRDWQLPSRCENVNPVTYGGPDLLRKGYAKDYAKPYTITEWNFSGPGRYRGLGGILTGAKAAVQDWDGLWRFAYSHSREALEENQYNYPGYFDVATDPLSQASDRASVCLFLRGDADSDDALTMDQQTGVMKFETRRTCGIFAPQGRYSAGVLTADIGQSPATVCLSSVDGKDLSESHRMLLTHITDIQGDGTIYADTERRTLLSWGTGTLVELGSAEIEISLLKPNQYIVYELDTRGERVRPLPVTCSAGRLSFTVSTMNPDGKGCIYYEIVKH